MSNSTDQMLILLPPNAKRRKHSETEIEDRLSDLPDCIVLHILSFLKAKYAVQTCILSTRWKDLWKRLPTLKLHSLDFSTFHKFTRFVSRLLTLRDGSTALHGLDFKGYGVIQTQLLKRIVKYAVSHNVRRLDLSVKCDMEHFPHCIFSSQTLTLLKLAVESKVSFSEKMLFPESLNLPALTTLHLESFVFRGNDNDRRAEPFSAFIKLNSLIIDNCTLSDARILCISSATLTNLTVHNHFQDLYSIELSSPNLRAFAFTGVPFQQLIGSNLSSVEQVSIDAQIWSIEEAKMDLGTPLNYPASPLTLFSWLLKLTNIKSLTVSASALQALFLIPHLLKAKLPILGSLESLKVRHVPLPYGFIMKLREAKLQKATNKSRNAAAKLRRAMKEEKFSSIPDGIVDFLLQNSPSAKIDIINC